MFLPRFSDLFIDSDITIISWKKYNLSDNRCFAEDK